MLTVLAAVFLGGRNRLDARAGPAGQKSVELILSGQSKAGAHGDFRRNALRRAYGTPTRRAYAAFMDAVEDPSVACDHAD